MIILGYLGYVIVMLIIPICLFRLYRRELLRGTFGFRYQFLTWISLIFIFCLSIWTKVDDMHFKDLSDALKYAHTPSDSEVYMNQNGSMAVTFSPDGDFHFEKTRRGWSSLPAEKIEQSIVTSTPYVVSIEYLDATWALVEVIPISSSDGPISQLSDSLDTKFVVNDMQKSIAFIKDMPEDYIITINEENIQVADLEIFVTFSSMARVYQYTFLGMASIAWIAIPIFMAMVSVKKTREKLQSNLAQKDTPPSDQE